MSENRLSLDMRYQDGDPLRTADGKEFYYEQYGKGDPHLTIVNNFFLIAPMWRTFTSRLAERNRVLTYDLRNQGASSSEVGEVAWRDHVDDLAAVLDGLGIERTYLVGTSISALICRDFAIAYPERVSGLLLVGPACTPGGGLRRLAVTRSWANSLETGGPAALWDHLYSMVFGEATMGTLGTPGYLGLREAFTSLHSVDIVLANLRSSLQASDDPALFREISCPTLLLVGEEDFLWSPSAIEKTEKLIRNVTTTCFPAIGHLPYMEDTVAFETAVQSFVDQVESSGDGVLPKLRELLREVVGDRMELPETGLDQRPLAEIGLDSWAFVALLASIEREFGIEWDVDMPMSALQSLEAIASHVGAHHGLATVSAESATERARRPRRSDMAARSDHHHLPSRLRGPQQHRPARPQRRTITSHLVTGATGFVGAALVLELLTRTETEVVCLVRGSDDSVATARLHDALDYAARAYDRDDLRAAIGARTRAVAGDVTAPGCGVNVSALPAIDQVWHAAASLKFEDRHAAEIHTMNVVGTANVLDLTKVLGGPVLNHISTAYVAGSRTGPIEESVPPDASHAHNLYEVSKIEAERLVAGSGLSWRILRPSVVIGHSATRAATTFSGMYGFISALLLFRRNVETHFGQLLRYRQIPLIAEPAVELNLVPVDQVVRNAVRIAHAGATGSVFHLTNAAAPTVGVAISEFFVGSGLRPPKFVGGSGQLTSLDKKLDDAMDFYSSYLAYGKTFDRTNTDAVCGPDASEFALPAPTVRDFVDWYRDRIRRDGRTAAPCPQTFAFRKRRPLAVVAC